MNRAQARKWAVEQVKHAGVEDNILYLITPMPDEKTGKLVPTKVPLCKLDPKWQRLGYSLKQLLAAYIRTKPEKDTDERQEG